MVLTKIKKALEKRPKFELIELPYIDVTEDPVRPELSLEFRQTHGRKIYGIKDEEGDIAAVMCFAFTHGLRGKGLRVLQNCPHVVVATQYPTFEFPVGPPDRLLITPPLVVGVGVGDQCRVVIVHNRASYGVGENYNVL